MPKSSKAIRTPSERSECSSLSVVPPPSRKIDSATSDLQAIGFEAAVGERVQYGFAECRPVELHRRRVNCDANVVGERAARLHASRIAPEPMGTMRPVLLRDRHELVGRH